MISLSGGTLYGLSPSLKMAYSLLSTLMATERTNAQAESLFSRRLLVLWAALSATSIALGIVFGRACMRCNSNLTGSVVLGLGLFIASLFFCSAVVHRLWRITTSSPVLMAFAIPISTASLFSIAGFLVSRGLRYMYEVEHNMCGLSFGVGLLYLAAPLWGIIARSQRERITK